MRLREIAAQDLSRLSLEQLEQILSRDCSDFLQVAHGTLGLYRGITRRNLDAFRRSTPTERIPKDTSNDIQQGFDNMLAERGFTALRKNSIFATGNYDQAMGYGGVFFVVPVNGFKFTWSPKVSDFYDLTEEYQTFRWSIFLRKATFDDNNQLGVVNQKLVQWYDNQIEHLKLAHEADEPYADISKWPDFDSSRYTSIWAAWYRVKILLNRGSQRADPEQRRDEASDVLGDFILALRRVPPVYGWLAKQLNFRKLIQTIKKVLLNDNDLNTLDALETEFQKKYQYTDENLKAAIYSNNEILIHGDYYAFSCDEYRDLFKYVFGRDFPWGS